MAAAEHDHADERGFMTICIYCECIIDRKLRSRETLEITSQSAMAKLPYRGIVALHFNDQRAYGGAIAKICDKGNGVENTGSSTLT